MKDNNVEYKNYYKEIYKEIVGTYEVEFIIDEKGI
tara:strand:+ start:373 stop:477 length:105 start_codon:yes stop_codon:yes gene_type:complete